MSTLADEIERRHVKKDSEDDYCRECLEDLPCTAIRAAAEIRALQASYDEMHTHNELERRALTAEIEALHAAWPSDRNIPARHQAKPTAVLNQQEWREPGARGRELEAARIEKEEADAS